MMRQIYIWMIIAAGMTAAGGCTHNNGDIGPYFGSWLLTEIKADGVTDKGYQGNVVWAFQSEIVQMTVVYPLHETTVRYGTWSERDGYLELDYTHRSDDMESGTGDYGFPSGLHLPDQGKVSMQVLRQTGRVMELCYSTGGVEYTYYLKKQF